MTNVLLLRSGDLEQNPGPNTDLGNLTEFELHLLADGMDPSDFTKVGLALGFTEAQLSRFKEDNIGSIMQATYKMLCEWLKTVRDSEARKTLSNKLKDINLVQLADIVEKGKAGDHIQSMTEDEFQRVIKEVKKYSAIHHCQIQADPLNSRLILEFKRIFTNLTLMEEDKGTEHKTPLLYEDLLKTKVNGVFPQRLLVEGEGGVGKTTLCAKIVWDWIHGAGYQDFQLVLLVLLREVKDKTIGDIIKSYLPDDNMVTAMQLNKYVFSHQIDVLLVLDGFDEFAGDLDSCYQIALIILNRLFKSGKVLITSRRWRSDEIRKIQELRRLYAFIAVEGFSDENLSSYVTKFFHPDTTSAEDLNRFISNNDVIRENMAPYPIYTAMLCIMWKDFDGERRIAMSKLQTFSQLIDEMVQFLVDHYLSKLGLTSRDEEWHVQRAEVLLHLSNIGCLAFQGLMERRLVFSEQEFKSWPGCINTGCQVGVLTKQAPILQRRQQRYNKHPADSSVQFPHKLFQEYLSGMYLASLHNSNRSEYDRLMEDIVGNAREFRELLYFTSAQQKEVGLDIITSLIESKSIMGCGRTDDDFIVDVAYESQDQTVARAVADHPSTLSSNTLEIRLNMQAHTVSGHIFIVNHRKLENLVIGKPCGRTASEDLAEFMCSSNTLSSVTILMPDYPHDLEDAHMHDVFYSVLARYATDTKIERLIINYIDLSKCQSASRDLAQFICKMPHLRELNLGSYHNRFGELPSGECQRIHGIDIGKWMTQASCCFIDDITPSKMNTPDP
ncbi:NACHT, LRR and PYD domains-containing protein 2-like [Lytechinus variegatus]|uniref:NACHT, LRR and PYD domains-containing protein 2-like n=1 Tax=Lytechinus variegatus TaxID=7654 RepID=UPI001BB1C461|nr:NACHT, LRR and PYD domains-containing protein 2-like [Lytechinus variegatus]